MLLLTEWDGRPRMFSARSDDVRTDSSEVRALRIEARYFSIRPDLTHSISILIYFFSRSVENYERFVVGRACIQKKNATGQLLKRFSNENFFFFLRVGTRYSN